VNSISGRGKRLFSSPFPRDVNLLIIGIVHRW
jgi:hypothetical protein